MSRPLRRVVLSALLIASVLLATACETDSGTDSGSEKAATSPEFEVSATSPSPTATGPAWTSFTGPLQRCGPQSPSVLEAPFDPITLRDPAVGKSLPSRWAAAGSSSSSAPDRPERAVRVAAVHAGRRRRRARGAGDRPVSLRRFRLPSGRGGDVHRRRPDRPRGGGSRLRPDRAARAPGRGGRCVDGRQRRTDECGHVAGHRRRRGPLGAGGVAGMDVVRRGRALDVPVLVAMATNEGPEDAAGARRSWPTRRRAVPC